MKMGYRHKKSKIYFFVCNGKTIVILFIIESYSNLLFPFGKD